MTDKPKEEVFTVNEKEPVPRYKVVFAAKLGDLKIGNPDGIPSKHAQAGEDDLFKVGEELTQHLVNPTTLRCTACIDGRCTLHNKDGSPKEFRLRRVGGSASNVGVAMNADAAFLNDNQDTSLDEKIDRVDEFVEDTTGFEPSAHEGGCGGANGEVDDNRAINQNPAIMETVKAFMGIPEVREYLGADFDSDLGEKVCLNAGLTADYLEANGWSGQAYVEKVGAAHPENVEILEVDEQDEKFHGHRENTLTVIIGDQTLDVDDEFVWNLKASKMVAEAMAGDRGHEGYVQALIAEIAKHVAVANRLPSNATPLIILKSDVALVA